MKLRRCEEDRWDFTEDDAALFPIRLTQGGAGYGFCPAKATWDPELVSLYRLLILSYETKQLLYSGGLADQPGWFIELMGWFVPRYDELKFYHRANSILGSPGNKKSQASSPSTRGSLRGGHKRRT